MIPLMMAQSACAAGTCSAVTIQSGDPSATNNTYVVAWGGRAWGEIFFARDTLIESITVWRDAQRTNDVTPWQLFITDTQPGYFAKYDPDVTRILLTGPTQVNQFGDGVHPVRFQFVLDPPYALPKSGVYFFCIKEATCFSGFPIVADTVDSYPDWNAWSLGRPPFPNCEGLGDFWPALGTDLVFNIEFCSAATPVRRPTWGELKIRYR